MAGAAVLKSLDDGMLSLSDGMRRRKDDLRSLSDGVRSLEERCELSTNRKVNRNASEMMIFRKSTKSPKDFRELLFE